MTTIWVYNGCVRNKRGPYRKVPVNVRFWSFVRKTDTCWLWTGATGYFGYGAFRLSEPTRRQVGAHRWSWIDANGPIPDGLFVLHSCDTPACVRPDHLHLGTQKENLREASARHRMSNGRGRWTTCRKGHPLTTVAFPSGTVRRCDICRADRTSIYRALKRSA